MHRLFQIKGIDFVPNDRMRILAHGTLFIKDVIRQDAGDYTCVAENSIAKDSITHKLIVLGKPPNYRENETKLTISLLFFVSISSTTIASSYTHCHHHRFPDHQIEATWNGLSPNPRLYTALQTGVRRLGNRWSCCRRTKIYDRKSLLWITLSSLCNRLQWVNTQCVSLCSTSIYNFSY